MRQIKFRGQRIDTKEWVYGDVIHYDSGEIKILEQNYRIWDILEGAYEVIPESVGQFTGLQDKNGVDIYEGDIVLFSYNYMGKHIVSFKEGKYNISGYVMSKSNIKGNIHEN